MVGILDMEAATERAYLTKETTCRLCGKSYKTNGILRHLDSCISTKLAGMVTSTPQKTLHLTIRGGELFRLDLAVPEACTLAELDHFLREIWLECCGHLSLFRNFRDWGGKGNEAQGQSMKFIQVGEYFRPDWTFYYVYDFGDTTTLTVRENGRWDGLFEAMADGYSIASCPHIRILARNIMPETCPCGKAAEFWKIFQPSDGFIAYCKECSKHKIVRPLVNSPRDGCECFDHEFIKPEIPASDIIPSWNDRHRSYHFRPSPDEEGKWADAWQAGFLAGHHAAMRMHFYPDYVQDGCWPQKHLCVTSTSSETTFPLSVCIRCGSMVIHGKPDEEEQAEAIRRFGRKTDRMITA